MQWCGCFVLRFWLSFVFVELPLGLLLVGGFVSLPVAWCVMLADACCFGDVLVRFYLALAGFGGCYRRGVFCAGFGLGWLW